MAKRITNLELRGRSWYYRVSFTLNRKTFAIRLSLETADPVVARERASRLDLALKRRWREVVSSPTVMTEDDKQSIMRAAALDARRSLQGIEADCLDVPREGPDDARWDYLLSLEGMRLVVRDLCVNGLHRDFGSREYEMHLLDGLPPIGPEQLQRLREILDGGHALSEGFRTGAAEALRRRNVDLTPLNTTLAAREIAKGTLLALREAIAAARDPMAALDAMLDGLEMPDGSTASSVVATPVEVVRSTTPPSSASCQGGSSPPAASDPNATVAPPPLSSDPPAVVTPIAGVWSLDVRRAADAFLAAHPRYDDDSTSSVWTPKTRSQFEAAIFLAAKFLGDEAVGAVDEMKLANLVRALRRLPANHHKTPAHAPLSLEEIAARAAGPTLGITTVNRHVRFLRLVFEWAWKRAPTRPVVEWSAFIDPDRRRKRDKRPAFTSDELKALFAGAVWRGAESRARRGKPGAYLVWDAAYWVPIMLAYTGARREEIAKLEVADVEEIDGVWAIRIRVNGGGRIKNAAAERDVPVADAVLALGFLDFVAYRRDAGEAFLFPELRQGARVMGDVFYKKWWRTFERAGLIPVGKDMHSIRHYVSTVLAAADVSEERRADLLGHTLTSETAGTYTKRTPLPILRQVVNMLPILTGQVRKIDSSA